LLFDIADVSQTPVDRLETANEARSMAMRSCIEDCTEYSNDFAVYEDIVLDKVNAMVAHIASNDKLTKYLEDNIIHKRIRFTQSDEETWMEIPILDGTYSIYAATPDEVLLTGGFLQRRKADLELMMNDVKVKDEAYFEAAAAEYDAMAPKESADSRLRLSRMNVSVIEIERKFSYLIFLLSRLQVKTELTGGV
jgi:hypothetical protein